MQRDVKPLAFCPTCKAQLQVTSTVIDDYLLSVPRPYLCPSCHRQDWWSAIVSVFEDNFFYLVALQLVGARTRVFIETVKAGQDFDLDLTRYGVPADARIVALGITPKDPILLAEVRQSFAVHEVIPHQMRLRAIPYSGAGEQGETNFMVTWYGSQRGLLEQDYLFDAAQEFSHETVKETRWHLPPRWERVIIPANVAIELAVNRAAKAALEKYGEQYDLRRKKLDYDQKLNFVLPRAAQALQIPPLRPHILEQINRLRTIRNQIMHTGMTKTPLTRLETATMLAAALFGVRYVELFRQRARL